MKRDKTLKRAEIKYALFELQDFCQGKQSWPPLASRTVITGLEGQSCKDACLKKGKYEDKFKLRRDVCFGLVKFHRILLFQRSGMRTCIF